MTEAITISDVRFSYTAEATVIDGVNLSVAPGQVIGLLGANGAGKTTLFRLLAGLIRPQTGELRIDGVSVVEDAIPCRRVTGFIPDEPLLDPHLSALENLNLFGLLWEVPRKELQSRAEALIRECGLWSRRNEWVKGFSRGMKQKVAFCAALLHSPKLLLMDEPFTGLDITSMYWAKERVRCFADEGGTVLFSSHIPELLDRVVDRLVVLEKGRIAYEGDRKCLETDGGAVRVFERVVAASGAAA